MRLQSGGILTWMLFSHAVLVPLHLPLGDSDIELALFGRGWAGQPGVPAEATGQNNVGCLRDTCTPLALRCTCV